MHDVSLRTLRRAVPTRIIRRKIDGRSSASPLRDHSTERESKDIAVEEPEAVQEIQRVRCHPGNRGGHLPLDVLCLRCRPG